MSVTVGGKISVGKRTEISRGVRYGAGTGMSFGAMRDKQDQQNMHDMHDKQDMRGTKHNSLSWIEVNIDHLKHNVREIRSRLHLDTKFMAVVKADGYGHGAYQAAKAALAAGADALAVSTYEEAVNLREAGLGLEAKILVLSPIVPEKVDDAVKYRLEITVFQASWLREMRKHRRSQQPLRIHIKMDTGMGRYGLRERSEFNEMLPLLMKRDIQVVGVYTHFATADQADDTYVREQFRAFREMRCWLEEAGFRGVTAHCANSAAAIRFPEMALDMVRVGASLYGILPIDHEAAEGLRIHLKPTLSLKTTIVHLKQVHKGESVGYDRSYTAAADEWIATLPIGYGDGWFRGYGGFHVIAEGHRVPIVGNICMNQTMVRLPCCLPVGTQVTLLGGQGDEIITLNDLAEHIGSIPQQVLTMLSPRLPRLFVEDDLGQ